MYIQPINNNINMYGKSNNSDFWKRIQQKIWDAIPEATIKDGANKYNRWDKVDKFLSKPAQNRLVMGGTAVISQPAIDSLNKKVDNETREVSIYRTLAKIIVGTISGLIVRGSCQKLVMKMTNPVSITKWGKALLPTKDLGELIKITKFLDNYRSALSTSMAILAMSITNFAIDAPLTIALTNMFNEKRLEHKKEQAKKGVNTNV